MSDSGKRISQVTRVCVKCKQPFSESEHGEATGFCQDCREKEGLVNHHSWSEALQDKGHYGMALDKTATGKPGYVTCKTCGGKGCPVCKNSGLIDAYRSGISCLRSLGHDEDGPIPCLGLLSETTTEDGQRQTKCGKCGTVELHGPMYNEYGERCPLCKSSDETYDDQGNVRCNNCTWSGQSKGALKRLRESHRTSDDDLPDSPLNYGVSGVKRIEVTNDEFKGDPRHPYFTEPRTIAFIDHSPQGDGAYIHYVAVHDNYQGKGLASLLVNKVYQRYPGTIDFGHMMEPEIGHIYNRYKQDPATADRTKGKVRYREAKSEYEPCPLCGGNNLRCEACGGSGIARSDELDEVDAWGTDCPICAGKEVPTGRYYQGREVVKSPDDCPSCHGSGTLTETWRSYLNNQPKTSGSQAYMAEYPPRSKMDVYEVETEGLPLHKDHSLTYGGGSEYTEEGQEDTAYHTPAPIPPERVKRIGRKGKSFKTSAKLPRYLYHDPACLKDIPSIRRRGLIPGAGRSSHGWTEQQDAVYLSKQPGEYGPGVFRVDTTKLDPAKVTSGDDEEMGLEDIAYHGRIPTEAIEQVVDVDPSQCDCMLCESERTSADNFKSQRSQTHAASDDRYVMCPACKGLGKIAGNVACQHCDGSGMIHSDEQSDAWQWQNPIKGMPRVEMNEFNCPSCGANSPRIKQYGEDFTVTLSCERCGHNYRHDLSKPLWPKISG